MTSAPARQRKLILTYDYELFFRRSGSVSRCLLEPTERILDLARHHGGMPSTFFVDATHLLRCRDGNDSARAEFEQIAAQLQRMVAEGHRVELHLHPHWLDAVREGCTWRFSSYDRYRLHALPQAEVDSLFVCGVQILEEIVSVVEPGYRVRAFRAGGWCIQPSAPVAAAMNGAGIHIDSSVGPGCSTTSSSHFFDFRGMHLAHPYRFGLDVTYPDDDGLHCEVPISTLRMTLADRLARRLEIFLSPNENEPFGDGEGMHVTTASPTVLGGLLRRLRPETTFLTLDNISVYTIRRVMRRVTDYLCLVSHPKLMSNHSLRLLQDLADDSGNHFTTVVEAAAKGGEDC